MAVALGVIAVTVGLADNAVTTVAGTALQAGFVDETGAAARFRFYTTAGAVVDNAGNVFVTDTQNNAIRKITSSGVVTTFAGSTAGTAGTADGTGTDARFFSPDGIAIDGAGNLYVADTGNNLIRKITAAGVVTTIAGTATAGYTDATGTAAQFRSPTGVAVGPASGTATTLYVADSQNNAIRRIDLGSQAVTTLAGSSTGASGFTDGTDTDALFLLPIAIASNAAGSVLYVSDSGNQAIRRIVISGSTATVTTFAGSGTAGYANGTGTAAKFNSPHGLAIDGSGNIIVADTLNQVVRSLSSTGVVTLLAGTPATTGSTDGLATSAAFNNPTGLAVGPSSVVYVIDAANFTVREIAAATAPTITTDPANTSVTVGTNATFTAAASGNPTVTYRWQRERVGDADFSNLSDNAVYSGTTTGTLTITGTTALMNGDKYRVVASNALGSANSAAGQLTTALGLAVSTLAGSPGVRGTADGAVAVARFWAPAGLAIDITRNVYVADSANNEIRVISPGGTVTTLAGKFGTFGSADGVGADARFGSPLGLAVDSTGNVFVADTGNQVIRRITPGGTVTTVAGSASIPGSADGAGSAAQFRFPGGIAVDSAGVLYVADTQNDTIRKIATDGTVSTLAGAPGQSGSDDGNGAAARFNAPYGIAVDRSGNVYVADTGNSAIRKITSARDVTTIAGTPGTVGSDDGTGADALFNQPKGIVVVDGTTLYVADTGNDTIRKVLVTGEVTTLAGKAGVAGSADAIGADARFNAPIGVAIDPLGNVFVSDTQNNTIRRTGAFTAPAITSQPSDQAVHAGTPASFRVVANATPAPSYQWQRQAAGTTGFYNIDDGAIFSGTATATLTIANPTEALSGDKYQVVVTNLVDPSRTSRAATLTVNPATVPPTITTQPSGLTVDVGDAAALTVSASGSGTLQYQWWKDGAAVAGGTNATLSFANVQPANAGTYTVVVTNSFGTVTSNPATLALKSGPVAASPQHAQIGLVGGSLTLSANITGAGVTSYQWRKNGVAVAGGTGATLTLSNLTSADAGLYDVTATNDLGSTTSSPIQVTVASVAAAPVITTQPVSQAAVVGSAVTFTVGAAAVPPVSYQWRKDGTFIAGATDGSYTIATVQTAAAGDYDVLATNAGGTTTSTTAALRVLSHSWAGVYFGTFSNGLGSFALYVRPDNSATFLGVVPTASAPLVDLSLQIGDGGNFAFTQAASSASTTAASAGERVRAAALGSTTIGGIISGNGAITGSLAGAVSGSISGSRVSDTGPTQNIAGVYLAGALNSAGSTLTIVSATGQAFSLTQLGGAADGGAGVVSAAGSVAVDTGRTAVSETITPATGTITATVAGVVNGSFAGASQAALSTQRLANISTRARVSGGDSVAIAGFVIGGTSSKLLLIRGVGPSLGTVGLAGFLAQPRLDLYQGDSLIASNAGVGTSPDAAAIAAAGDLAGAFAPTLKPADSALLITLAPGTYTAKVSAADNGAGVALVEVYDLSSVEAGQKLLNISTRAPAGTGDGTLIAGVVVAGSVPKRVLVRAVGPGLAAYHVDGVLAQPVLTLKTQAGQTIAANTGWTTSSDAAAISEASNDTGAFPLVDGDSAMIVTLAPGAYSAQVTGVGGSTGVALVEVYELQ